jgi:hypothetical protein
MSKAEGFKYFIKLQKAYQQDGQYYVQGIASGILEDRDDERMSEGVLEAFVNSLPMPLTDAHPERGPILGDIGEVIYAEITDDENKSLFIKARLDMDHPAVPYLIKQLEKGKKFAFSIEGTNPVAKTVWSDRLNKMITEYIEVIPKAISITSEPSYIGSFLEMVTKSYRNNIKTNLLNNNTMKEAKVLKSETDETILEVEKTQPEPQEELAKAEKRDQKAVDEAVDEKPEEKASGEPPLSLNAPETTKESVGTIEKVAEPVGEQSFKDLVKEKLSEIEALVEGETPEEEVAEEAKEDAGEVVKEVEGEVAVEDGKAPMEAIKAEDATAPETSEEPEETASLSNLASRLDRIEKILSTLVATDKDVHSEMGKSFASTVKIMKSFHDEIEILKDLPLAKRSKVIAKSFEDRAETKPQNMKDLVSNFI